ncbi:DUF2807 domain-containing protein [Phenylobacterium sp. J367]|uniref:DUF2807 domain-containing protein n=1 Tax=Phenylobacterium sp. J367 TaxID=2898435 RepID=UPI0021512DA1|nr:DUF2807 domain-containing protein [Phenylobacterium sp. J367]MCR5880355.1 DUF2807 domain-containing protein [Phenylobacterium sp. J367]
MIRTLLLIAVAGFFLSLVTISTAVAIGGPDVLARGAWSNWNWDWDDDWDHPAWDHRRNGEWDSDRGPQATRELVWSGGDTLELDVLADVVYTQAPGPAKLTVSGRKRAVELLRIGSDGRVYLDDHRSRSRLHIVLSAPDIRTFRLNGSDRLTIADYDQDVLNVEISGNAEVQARGRARLVEVDISGSGEADLGGLQAQIAEVDISGSGEATIAPTEEADLEVSGSGDITLLTQPKRMNTDVSGSGSIRQETEGDRITPTPSPSDTPSPAPPSSPTPQGVEDLSAGSGPGVVACARAGLSCLEAGYAGVNRSAKPLLQ